MTQANKRRADRLELIIRNHPYYKHGVPELWDMTIMELLADIMHWCDQHKIDVKLAWIAAQVRFDQEKHNPFDQGYDLLERRR